MPTRDSPKDAIAQLIDTIPPSPDRAAGQKERVAIARLTSEERRIHRQANLAAWNDYIGFSVCKVAGVIGCLVGGLEVLDPSYLSITINKPGLLVGGGLALLTGKSLVSLIAKLEKAHSK